MSFKTILVHLDNGASCVARMNSAIELANDHNAHLSGLYIVPTAELPMYDYAYIPASLVEDQQREAHANADKARDLFEATVRDAGFTSDFVCVEGNAEQHLRSYSCYADLVVVGQTNPDESRSVSFIDDDYVVLSSACPVLFVPYIGASKPIGKRIMVAWNGSREAARAVNGAMPILENSTEVEVVAVNPSASDGDIPTADACLRLARHNINAVGQNLIANDIDIASALLSRIADLDIDLLVMGGYGHTRLREAILGGATRDILSQMTVPVLMAH